MKRDHNHSLTGRGEKIQPQKPYPSDDEARKIEESLKQTEKDLAQELKRRGQGKNQSEIQIEDASEDEIASWTEKKTEICNAFSAEDMGETKDALTAEDTVKMERACEDKVECLAAPPLENNRETQKKTQLKGQAEGPARERIQDKIQDKPGADSQRRSRRMKTGDRKPGPSLKITIAVAMGTIAAVCLIGSLLYFQVGKKYDSAFFPHTIINGVDASQKTAEEVRRMISADVDGYTLTIEGRGQVREQITKEEIGLHTVFDGSLERMIEEQDGRRWLKYWLGEDSTYQIETMIAYDEEKFEEAVKGLDCLDPSTVSPPENARLSDYVPGQGYDLIPSEPGNLLDEALVKEAISEAVLNLRQSLSLDEADCYVKPEVGDNDETLLALVSDLNRYTGVTVTYQFGDSQETLSGDTIYKWLSISETSVELDEEAVATYVKELAVKYDTYNKAKTLKTSYGPTIKVTGGTYGWKINRGEETKALIDIIKSGESQEREPIYAQKAAGHGENDYGDTYVEINLTAQHLYYYKDGSLVVESDFVSGNLAKNYGTPAGTYPLTYKQRNATLKGEDYRTPVDYWMPFNGGIGMHDANWRSSFGGEIYKTSGSHGCVNLPPSVAKKIYENIEAGAPVICYNLEGSQKNATTLPQTKPPQTPPSSGAAGGAAPSQPQNGTAPAPSESGSAAPPQETTQAGPPPTQSPGTPPPTQSPGAPPPTQAPGTPPSTQSPGTPPTTAPAKPEDPEDSKGGSWNGPGGGSDSDDKPDKNWDGPGGSSRPG